MHASNVHNETSFNLQSTHCKHYYHKGESEQDKRWKEIKEDTIPNDAFPVTCPKTRELCYIGRNKDRSFVGPVIAKSLRTIPALLEKNETMKEDALTDYELLTAAPFKLYWKKFNKGDISLPVRALYPNVRVKTYGNGYVGYNEETGIGTVVAQGDSWVLLSSGDKSVDDFLILCVA